jgi:hypothetical protein
MKQPLAPKIGAGILLTFMATIAFLLSGYLIGTFVVLPLYFLSLRVVAKNNVQFIDHKQNSYSSSSTMHRTPLSSGAAYSSHKNYVGMGCYSLGQRINRYGY